MDSPTHLPCVLLADPNVRLIERMRGLLETTFGSVFVVADSASLLNGLEHLRPTVAILDLKVASGDLPGLSARMKACSFGTHHIVLTMHESSAAAEAALSAGMHGVVLKRLIARDLLPAVDAVLKQERFVTPELAVTFSGQKTIRY